MCGHGTIGLVASLALHGPARAGRRAHRHAGRRGRRAAARRRQRRRRATCLATARRAGVAIDVPGIGQVRGDVAWGGNWFFLVQEHGQALALRNVEVADRLRLAHRARRLNAAGLSRGGSRRTVRATRPIAAIDSRNFVLVPGQGVRPLALRHRHEREARLPRRRRNARGRRGVGAGKHHRQHVHRPVPLAGPRRMAGSRRRSAAAPTSMRTARCCSTRRIRSAGASAVVR